MVEMTSESKAGIISPPTHGKRKKHSLLHFHTRTFGKIRGQLSPLQESLSALKNALGYNKKKSLLQETLLISCNYLRHIFLLKQKILINSFICLLGQNFGVLQVKNLY